VWRARAADDTVLELDIIELVCIKLVWRERARAADDTRPALDSRELEMLRHLGGDRV